jgi:hypothetical protein
LPVSCAGLRGPTVGLPTVEDLGAFNEPWSAVVRYQLARTPVTLVEEPCAENDVGHPGNFFQIPVAAKTDF